LPGSFDAGSSAEAPRMAMHGPNYGPKGHVCRSETLADALIDVPGSAGIMLHADSNHAQPDQVPKRPSVASVANG
jgi:hypothetical protein